MSPDGLFDQEEGSMFDNPILENNFVDDMESPASEGQYPLNGL